MFEVNMKQEILEKKINPYEPPKYLANELNVNNRIKYALTFGITLSSPFIFAGATCIYSDRLLLGIGLGIVSWFIGGLAIYEHLKDIGEENDIK